MQNTGIDLRSDVGDPVLIKNMLRGLQKAGNQVSVLLLEGRSVKLIEDLSQLNLYRQTPLGITGIKPFLWFESGTRRLQSKLKIPYFAFFDSLRFFDTCCKALTAFDICHEYQGLFSSGAALACARLHIPYVITAGADIILERDISKQPLRGFHRNVAALEAKLTYRLARKVICVSEPAREHFVNNWGVLSDKITVIPNGVDLELFGEHRSGKLIRAKFGLLDEPVIVFVGGFQPWHGLDFLVDCFSLVLTEVPRARLILVGDGPVHQDIEHKIEALGLRNAVILSGTVPQSEVPDYLATADIAVLPYPPLPRELWFSPLKLYEYMSSGKAIVATRSGQIAEVIEDRHSGVLVEPGDVRSFTQALVRLLENPYERERLGRNARRQAVECHSWERQTQRLESVYQEVSPLSAQRGR